MISGWKLRRELVRLGRQLRAIPEAFWEPVAQRAHDRRFAAGFPVATGAVPASAKIALLLIYQPRKVAASIVHTCDHLVSRGYAPLVVSNTALTDASRAALLPHVWQIMERPNFGYDFGGYRDGLRHLWAAGMTPDKVLILNDSVWFPLDPGEEMIARMEASDADVVGSIMRGREARRGGRGLRFLESYCTMLDGRVFASRQMRRFWEDMRLTSNKFKVIRRGERAHSEALEEAGFRLASVYRREDFLAALERQDDAFLRRTLVYAAFQEASDMAARDRILAAEDGPAWRERALDFIRRAEARGQFYSQFPYANVRLLGYPLLKKSRDRPSTLWRGAHARAVEAGDLPAPPEPILSELRMRIGRDIAGPRP
ncbi:MAG: rhamnan synthesis protein F family [Defluviimonas sp.]|uniref:rhamnan synthesis F family protein n=1 Tax=Albidovulum sp. TaxID=1872424 RepID=UPI001DAB4F8E|nr:rhamnan synthesis protein F family [Paracoccaceae bacterium]MCC0063647.1 rhamnan synthesis protein F family [Defluviimonas sp.]